MIDGHADGVARHERFHGDRQLPSVHLQHGMQVLRPYFAHITEADGGRDCGLRIVRIRNGRNMVVGDVHQRSHP